MPLAGGLIMQFYDPDKLVAEVAELLRNRGLDPRRVDWALAQKGACMLIRGLDAMPAIDPVDAYSRSLDSGPWPDADDRRASA
jgi:hypothetical protein